jgi:hypothetical protein
VTVRPDDIAIIGMGCLFPGATSLEEYWQNIQDGVDCINTIEANSSQLVATVVAQQALEDAGYGPNATFDRDRVSCVLAVTGALELIIPLGVQLGHPISRTAILDAGGSLGALHVGMLELRAGNADLVVTGGVGEGAGCVILKRLADARRDGDRVYAVLKAIGISSDGSGQPSGDGQAKALRAAYADAGIAPATVELVEAHGTGTNAGVAGLIKAALALHHRVQPPTIKIGEPAEALGDTPFHALVAPRPWVRGDDHPRRAAVSEFGVGGSNFHCVLEEAPAGGTRPAVRMGGDVQILAYSGADGDSVAHAVTADVDALTSDDGEWTAVRALAASRRNVFDALASARLCIVVNRGDDVRAALRDTLAMLTEQKDTTHWQTPNGAWFDRRPPARSVAALFPGQGSQYVGMLADVACVADPMMESLRRRLTMRPIVSRQQPWRSLRSEPSALACSRRCKRSSCRSRWRPATASASWRRYLPLVSSPKPTSYASRCAAERSWVRAPTAWNVAACWPCAGGGSVLP